MKPILRARALLLRALHSRWTRGLALLACLLYFAQLAHKVLADPVAQWDFTVYYTAAQAWGAGEDPYSLEALSRVRGQPVGLPFVYPPATLRVFHLFTALELPTAARLHLLLKLLALGGLGWLWLGVFVRDAGARLLLLVLCMHAFRRPLRVDLVAGNVTVYEQLLVWGGLACLLAGRRALFAVLIGLSASFKLVTLALLPLALLVGTGRRERARSALLAMALGTGVFLALTLPSLLLEPQHLASFRANVAGLDERGASNPASLALLRDGLALLQARGMELPRAVEPLLYGLFVLAVGALAAGRLRRLPSVAEAPQWLALALLTYGLVLPRFKDYAYALLLVPAALVLSQALRTRPLPALLVLGTVLGGRLGAYMPLAAAVGLFVLACLPPPPAQAAGAAEAARPAAA